MIEKTDIIIKEKLSTVESAPPEGLWDKIEAGIEAQNTQAFDGAVNEKLHNYAAKPNDSIYVSIAKKLALQSLMFKIKIAAVAASIIIVSTLFLFNKKEIGSFEFIPIANSNTIELVNSDSDRSVPNSSATAAINESFITKNEKNNTYQSQANYKVSEISNNSSSNNTLALSYTEESTLKSEESNSNQVSNKPVNSDILINKFKLNIYPFNIKPDNYEMFDSKAFRLTSKNLNLNKQDVDNYYFGVLNPEDEKSKSTIKRNTRYINKYSIGFNYSPNAIYTANNLDLNHALGIDLKYQNMNLIVQSGLIIEYIREKADYSLNYDKYEFQKKQLMFDSLDFTSGGRPTPLNPYYVDVYDSSNYIYNSTANDHYVVMKLPLLIGYQWNRRDLGIFIKGGISYNISVYKNRTGVFDLDAYSKQNSFYYPVNYLYNSNIEYIISTGFDYHIHRNLSFTSELISRYYKNPFYTNLKNSNAFGFGLKLGILYEL